MMKEKRAELAETLKTARETKELSQTAVAEATGYNIRTVQRAESVVGPWPAMDTVIRLTECLGLTLKIETK